MENLRLSFNVVFPVFLSIALGYLLRLLKVWNEPTISKVNGLVFRVFLPVHVFLSIYRSDLSSVFNPKIIGFTCGSIVLLFLFLSVLIPLIEKDPKRRGVMVQGIMRSNFVILGMPIVQAVYGDIGGGTASALITIVVPLFNILSVITLEINRSRKIHIFQILLGIIKNPLIIASALGILCIVFHIRVPALLAGPMDTWASISTPLALIALGGSFEFSKVSRGFRQLLTSVLGRLIFVPAVFLGFAILLGFRGVELVTLGVVFGAPTAVSSYTMAQQQGGDGELAGQIVVFTSVLSMFTLFGMIFLLKTFAFI